MKRRPPRIRLRGTVFLAGLAILAVFSTLPSAGADDPPPQASQPTLPPLSVLEPELFDERGCERLFPEPGEPAGPAHGAACGPSELPSGETSPPPDLRTWRHLLGFVGPQYAKDLQAGEVILLEDSVTVANQGSWRAWGLVRNETRRPVGVTVTASLFGPDGTLLGAPSGSVAVDPLRPGEPGPFAISSDVPVSTVTRVEWSIQTRSPGPGVRREFLVGVYWTLPYGVREQFDLVYSDPDGPPPYPFVLSGSVENLRGTSVQRPAVVAAWLDQNLRVRWVASAEVGKVPFNPERAATFAERINPRVSAPFFLAVQDPEVGPLLADLAIMLWAVGS